MRKETIGQNQHLIKESILIFVLFISISLTLYSSSSNQRNLYREHYFNADWKFTQDIINGAENPDFNDSAWTLVSLPHDFSLNNLPAADTGDQIGPFSKNAPDNGNATGHFMGGTGWYRKSFTLSETDENKVITVCFDGVYMETQVWVNGYKVGEHKNGYTPFWFDITPYLNKPGDKNVLAVKVENNGRNSRWYSGSGIYRNVHLTVADPVHIEPCGVYVTTPNVCADYANINVEVALKNELKRDLLSNLTINIKDEQGNIVGKKISLIALKAESGEIANAIISVRNPYLWSIGNPALYKAEIIIETENGLSDKLEQSFGIRTIEFSAKKGFLLNGEPILLKGGCVHHDNGFLGAAAFDRAEERKIEILKNNGFNAIRISHNPPSKSLLNACDRLGILVIDEFTDMWEYYKSPQDYSNFFKQWWNKDLTNWILGNRNHPSIIMWSIGNEIYEPNDNNRVRIAKELTTRIKELDTTRAVTTSITGFFYPNGWETTAPVFETVDVCGYNYMLDKLESDHQLYPERIIYTSESYSTSAYDYWKAVEKYPYVIGDFIWTAWEYLGESNTSSRNYIPESQNNIMSGNFSNVKLPKGKNIFDILAKGRSTWPKFMADCSDIDITGEAKASMGYRNILWDNSKIEVYVHEPMPEGMIETGSAWAWQLEYPYWNWPDSEGKIMQVRVFTKAPEVALVLNGKIIANKKLTEEDKYSAVFKVPYQPGELKAIGLKNGQEVVSKTLKTPDEPVAIKMTVDRTKINAGYTDLAFIKIEVVDKTGELASYAKNSIRLEVQGNGKLIGSGNANPSDMAGFNQSQFDVYYGKAQAIIRPMDKKGKIKVRASSANLRPAEIIITVQ